MGRRDPKTISPVRSWRCQFGVLALQFAPSGLSSAMKRALTRHQLLLAFQPQAISASRMLVILFLGGYHIQPISWSINYGSPPIKHPRALGVYLSKVDILNHHSITIIRNRLGAKATHSQISALPAYHFKTCSCKGEDAQVWNTLRGAGCVTFK